MIYRLVAYSLILMGIVGTIYMGFEGIYREEYAIRSITRESLDRQLNDSAQIILIDVRTLKEIEERPASWDGTLQMPLLELESRSTELKDYRQKRLVVLCPTGRRSHEGARILKLAGYDAVYLEHGIFGDE